MKFIAIILAALPFTTFAQSDNAVVEANNSFGLDVAYHLAGVSDYLISPYSISSALAMTYVGALGETRNQIKKTLHYPDDKVLFPGYRKLSLQLESSSTNSTLSIANKLWVGKDRIQMNTEFVDSNKKYFFSTFKELNFGDPVKSSQTINDWISDNTGNKIKDMIKPDHISGDLVLMLTNAVYFKSNWKDKFDPAATTTGTFKNDKNQSIEVSYMSNHGHYRSFEDLDIHMIELPYSGDDFSFIIILPKKSMADLEDLLLPDNLNLWQRYLHREEYELIKIPKFKTSYNSVLNNMLSELGMPKAFNGAEFEGMGSAGGRIELGYVIHETFIEVNEEGTEAAAATAVGAVARSASHPKKFIADRPFIYFIRHNPSKTILFLGKLSNPKY